MLARYTDGHGRLREVFARSGAFGSVLVVDRDALTLCDARLVAHLAADEASENAAHICRLYLADTRSRACRPLTPEDSRCAPPVCQAEPSPPRTLAHEGRVYRIRRVRDRRVADAFQLRWCHASAVSPRAGVARAWAPLSLREVIERFESYQPMLDLTRLALSHPPRARGVCTATLRSELRRVQASPVVLNRGLREAVLRAVRDEHLSLSEIAIRCGRVKRDRRGRCSGETSWLARRVGLLPECGATRTVRWVHSDVLALIAREGLGVSPREVEL